MRMMGRMRADLQKLKDLFMGTSKISILRGPPRRGRAAECRCITLYRGNRGNRVNQNKGQCDSESPNDESEPEYSRAIRTSEQAAKTGPNVLTAVGDQVADCSREFPGGLELSELAAVLEENKECGSGNTVEATLMDTTLTEKTGWRKRKAGGEIKTQDISESRISGAWGKGRRRQWSAPTGSHPPGAPLQHAFNARPARAPDDRILGGRERAVGVQDAESRRRLGCTQGVVVSTHRSRPTRAWSRQHAADGVAEGDRRRWGALEMGLGRVAGGHREGRRRGGQRAVERYGRSDAGASRGGREREVSRGEAMSCVRDCGGLRKECGLVGWAWRHGAGRWTSRSISIWGASAQAQLVVHRPHYPAHTSRTNERRNGARCGRPGGVRPRRDEARRERVRGHLQRAALRLTAGPARYISRGGGA
ncbi:hypothetical protein B0H10DRAFT_1960989 [Mycena sp. CBHHK59/15]|nr:hypothetical protein B0H10DRAFT_1960989 [Mycena sp. CBHHK59/15]